MDQIAKTITSEETSVARWIGRVIIAVILGEAIWNLIVSVINYVVVPWLGDLLGRSWNLPPSFTQRPYNYLDLSVSVLEFGVAAIVAVVLNYFFERRKAQKVKPLKSSSVQGSPRSAPEVAKFAPQAVAVGAKAQISPTVISPVDPPAPTVKQDPVVPPSVVPEIAVTPAPLAAPPPVASSPPAASSPAVVSTPAKPVAPASIDKTKPKKPKAVYYNIVGEPMPSDED
jgi:hypothetical protein